MPKAYGLTGGIASGKSTVAQMFRDLGVSVISADQISHDICKKGEKGWTAIKEVFGEDYFTKEGELDRKKLAGLIFVDPEKRKKLEQVEHPLIMEEVRSQIRKYFDSGKPLVLVEAAVLMEAGFAKEFHGVIVVSCKEEQQIERMCARDGMSRDEALKRIRAQWPMEKKMKLATFVIDTSHSLDKTKEETKAVFEKISPKKDRKPPLWH